MKRLITTSIIALALGLTPSIVQAQGRTPATDSAAVGFDVGLFRPSDDELKPALSLDGFYEYYFSPRTSLRLGLGWTNPEFDRDPNTSIRHVRVGGDLIYNWEGNAIHPFVGAGLGVYIMEPRNSNGDELADSEAKLGGVLLGGLEFFTSPTFSIKGEASYHLISNVDNFGPANPDGLKLSVGVKKYF